MHYKPCPTPVPCIQLSHASVLASSRIVNAAKYSLFHSWHLVWNVVIIIQALGIPEMGLLSQIPLCTFILQCYQGRRRELQNGLWNLLCNLLTPANLFVNLHVCNPKHTREHAICPIATHITLCVLKGFLLPSSILLLIFAIFASCCALCKVVPMQPPPLPGQIGPIPLNWAYLPNHSTILRAKSCVG